MNKICRVCEEEKLEEEFEIKSGKHTNRCLICKNAYQREYYSREGNREKQVEAVRKHREENPYRRRSLTYAISEDAVETILNGVCEICGSENPVIDHDHETGIVRGGLCLKCNTGIGKLGDSVDGLYKAIVYLSKGLS